MSFKDVKNLFEWRGLSAMLANSAAGSCLAFDLRNTEDRDPWIYLLLNATSFYRYNIKNDGWQQLASPALAGTFGAGAGAVFMAGCGPYGTVAAGCSTTSIVLSTALPAAVGQHQLANRGDGIGYKIRIIGNAAGGGSSGTISESYITANTGGTTPTLTVSPALSFTPAAGDGYEFVSGKVFLMSSGTTAAGSWKSYDIATNSFATLSITNLIATGATDFTAEGKDERFVPSTRAPGDGFYGTLVCTGVANGSITGQAAAGDAAVLQNQYRNFQVRIVADTTNKTAVGQRRKIASHTAGASPVYTLYTNWTVNPSVGATFVIEQNNDILVWNGTATVTYSYLAGYSADASWSTAAAAGGATQYANPATAHAAGAMALPSFAITPDAGKLARHSYTYFLVGGATSTMDLFDIAGGATGLWTAGVVYGGKGATFTTGSCSAYDAISNAGRYTYINQSGTQAMFRFDALNRVLEAWGGLRFAQSTAIVGGKMATLLSMDGATKYSWVFHLQNTLTWFWGGVINR